MNAPKLTPAIAAAASAFCGCAMVVSGVFLLAGLGWALIAGAVPPLALATVLFRGLQRVR
jgi:hypothetical protein